MRSSFLNRTIAIVDMDSVGFLRAIDSGKKDKIADIDMSA